MSVSEEIECLYDGYLATPEGANVADILLKTDKLFSNYVHRELIQRFKKEVLVQLIELFMNNRKFEIPDDSQTYTQI